MVRSRRSRWIGLGDHDGSIHAITMSDPGDHDGRNAHQSRGRELVVNRSPRDYYRNFGIDTDLNEVIQCGLLVITPKLHLAPFEICYVDYEAKIHPGTGYRYNLEMRPLSFEIVRRGWHHFIDQRFNLILSNYLYLAAPYLSHSDDQQALLPHRRLAVTAALTHAHFLHFAGGAWWRQQTEHLIEGVSQPEDFAGLTFPIRSDKA